MSLVSSSLLLCSDNFNSTAAKREAILQVQNNLCVGKTISCFLFSAKNNYSIWKGGRERGRQTDRQTDRDTDRQTDRQAETEGDRDRVRDRQRQTERQKQTDTERKRDREGLIDWLNFKGRQSAIAAAADRDIHMKKYDQRSINEFNINSFFKRERDRETGRGGVPYDFQI